MTPLFEELLTRRTDPLEIDATDVSHVSAACLQVLLSAEQDWKARNSRFEFTNVTEDCRKNLTLMGADPNWFTSEVLS